DQACVDKQSQDYLMDVNQFRTLACVNDFRKSFETHPPNDEQRRALENVLNSLNNLAEEFRQQSELGRSLLDSDARLGLQPLFKQLNDATNIMENSISEEK